MIFLIIGINNTDSEMVVAGFKINALGKITIFVGGTLIDIHWSTDNYDTVGESSRAFEGNFTSGDYVIVLMRSNCYLGVCISWRRGGL